MRVSLQSITPDAEKTLVYIARVSNPANQSNPNYARLIRYCIEHQHWSVFEHAHMTLEIETSLAIATQILRHRSFTFQQFSQRYSDPLKSGLEFEPIELRRQADKNRQSSAEPIDNPELEKLINDYLAYSGWLYRRLLEEGVARECARMVLPQTTRTRMYMTGDVRSWIHYIQLREKPDTQLEHRRVALAAKDIFVEQLPVTAEALGFTNNQSDNGQPTRNKGENMPRYMVQLKDHYLVWSTIVDAPIYMFDDIDEMYEWSLREYGEHWRHAIDEAFERLKAKGTSSRRDRDAIDTIWLNRAGPDELPLTIEGIYRHYCLDEPVQEEWVVPRHLYENEDYDLRGHIVGQWVS